MKRRTSGAPVRLLGASAVIFTSIAESAVAHTGGPIQVPTEDLSAWESGVEFLEFGAEHILLGFDHLLFLAGLAVLSRTLRDLIAILGIFAVSYSAFLIGGTLAGLSVPGDLIDAVIAISVGFVGVQIAFGDRYERLPSGPRWPAAVFGIAHGLGLSSLIQELRLPGDDLLPSVIGFNVGVELGQLVAIGAFAAGLYALRAFPFPRRERIPAGFALISAATVLLAFVAFGVGL